DMFESQVASYRNERPLGSASAGGSHFDSQHPLYRAIAGLAQLRSTQSALRRGQQIVRSSGPQPGLFAVSRIDPDNGREILIAFNTSLTAVSAQVLIDSAARRFVGMHGECEAESAAPGSYHIAVAALDFVVCAAVAG